MVWVNVFENEQLVSENGSSGTGLSVSRRDVVLAFWEIASGDAQPGPTW